VIPVRVGTWNVHGLRTGGDAVARVVRDEELDVLLVQESGPRRRLRRLGERLGWVVCADPRAFPRRRVQNAVLIRPGLVGIVRSRLLRFEAAPFLQPRGALIAQVDERWTLASIHLGPNREQRLHQATELVRTFEGVHGPVVIGGDLNAHADDPATLALATRFPDVWPIVGDGSAGLTMPAAGPTARIDYVFADPSARPVRAWIAGGASVSDHLLVVADLELPD
jgi:endonuclease/exonuclease/phosphatase family metal-dependent hydrolase